MILVISVAALLVLLGDIGWVESEPVRAAWGHVCLPVVMAYMGLLPPGPGSPTWKGFGRNVLGALPVGAVIALLPAPWVPLTVAAPATTLAGLGLLATTVVALEARLRSRRRHGKGRSAALDALMVATASGGTALLGAMLLRFRSPSPPS